MPGMIQDDEKTGEVIAFEKAAHAHVHARKEEKLRKIQKAFKAVTREKFIADRAQKRKNKRSKKKKR